MTEEEKFIEHEQEEESRHKNVAETEFKNEPVEQPHAKNLLEQNESEKKAADALIIAALMGNSIMRFKAGAANSKQNKRVAAQSSAPGGAPSAFSSMANSIRVENTKSLNESEITKPDQVCMEEMSTHTNANNNNINNNNNTATSKGLINKLNSGIKSNTSSKSNQNISSLSNTRNTTSSKASKCMHTFFFGSII